MMLTEQERLIQVLYSRIAELESKLAASEEARKRVSSQYETVCNDLADTRLKLAAAEKLLEHRKVPAGWQLVPIEPTDEMLDAGHCATSFDSWGGIKIRWIAMLSTSPTYKEQP